ncbi:hypothetical protein D3C85_1285040 [compost metagenome]
MDTAGREHPRGHLEVHHRHLGQRGIVVERRSIAIAAPHGDAVGAQVSEHGVCDRPILALEEQDPVGEVRLGEQPVAGTLVVVPGAHEQVVVALLQPTQRTGPGHLDILGGMTGTLQRGTHQLGRQAIAGQARIGEGRPEIGGHSQLLGAGASPGEQQREQGMSPATSHPRPPRKSLNGGSI